MNSLLRIALLALLSPFVPLAHAAETTTGIPGLAVGAKAPGFSLPSSTGADVELAALLARGPVALVFVRSADWCPFCRTQLQELQKELAQIEASGLRLVALSYDAPEVNRAAAAKLGLAFPLLSDVGSRVIDAYGIRNLEAKGRGVGVPHPVVFLIGGDGAIAAKLNRDGYRERPEAAEIIAAARSLAGRTP